jgi:hypothetical protein
MVDANHPHPHDHHLPHQPPYSLWLTTLGMTIHARVALILHCKEIQGQGLERKLRTYPPTLTL